MHPFSSFPVWCWAEIIQLYENYYNFQISLGNNNCITPQNIFINFPILIPSPILPDFNLYQTLNSVMNMRDEEISLKYEIISKFNV